MCWTYKKSYSNMVPALIIISFGAVIHYVSSIEVVSDTPNCHQSERQALLSFKHHITDPSNRLSSWAPGRISCCGWHGVVCDNLTGHVQELHLQGPYSVDEYQERSFEGDHISKLPWLGGKFDNSLLDLKYLRYLDLSNNDFGGIQVPLFVGSMHSLTYLNLSYAGFRGEIPSHLGNLSNLMSLGIAGNGIQTKNLRWLSGLFKLRYLDLSYVLLPETSDDLQGISALPLLEQLHLYYCGISQFPNLVNVNFSNLVTLDLSLNEIGSFPGGLENRTSLKCLDLSSCRINSTLPNWLYKFSQLEKLMLRGNYLRGTIADNVISGPVTDSLGSLDSLLRLDFSMNQLNGVLPQALGQLHSLEYLDFSVNKLNGVLPQALGQLHRLEYLDLSYNSITGSIPDSIGSLNSLAYLDISTNQLNGTLPQTVGQLNGLHYLNLANNLIGGVIPESMGSLHFLRYLILSGNQFSGNLTASLGQLIQLDTLDIGHNTFEGLLLPVFFANLTSLRYLIASGNRFRIQVSLDWIPPLKLEIAYLSSWYLGPKFPKWLSSLENLKALDISNAGINDTVPAWFGNITSQINYLNISHNQIHGKISSIAGSLSHLSSQMVILDLSNNLFSGNISSLLCGGKKDMISLKYLHLGNNDLFGEIPECWSKWPSLVSIELQNNNLTGSLPKSLGSLNKLWYLHLRNNSLSGMLPSSLQNCRELMILDIAENKLNGTFPKWIGQKLSNVRILSLGFNYFDGYIPNELCALSSLVILDMTNNNVSGPIPNCLADFRAMTKQSISDFQSWNNLTVSDEEFSFEESATLVTKALVLEYSNNLRFMTAIDLSNNSLSGPIPEDITNLVALRSLNLSGNSLTGKIPKNMDNMYVLESLDLSMNRLSGQIPQSIASMTFLEFLNVSFNELVGRIPTGTQIQGFNASSFIGNKLCGPPVSANCGSVGSAPIKQHEDDQLHGPEYDALYVSLSLGYVVGLGAVIALLLYSTAWRLHYFRWLDSVWDRLWVWAFLMFRTPVAQAA